jgi:ssDNA-binding replication factor A large subunit
VRDVEVNVMSVAFTVVDDRTIVFRPWVPESELELELPYRAQVDIIVRPADQVQTMLTYR